MKKIMFSITLFFFTFFLFACHKQTYKVTLVYPDKEITEEVSELNKLSLQKLDYPKYVFKGWYLDRNFQEEYTKETKFNQFVFKLYAKYEREAEDTYSYEVTLVVKGKPSQKFLLHNNLYLNLKNINDRQNFVLNTDEHLEKWFYDSEFQKPIEGNKLINFDITIYGLIENDKKINFYYHPTDPTKFYTRKYYKASDIIRKEQIISEPIPEGYAFRGWMLDKELTIPLASQTVLTENMALYARYEKLKKITLEDTEFGSHTIYANSYQDIIEKIRNFYFYNNREIVMIATDNLFQNELTSQTAITDGMKLFIKSKEVIYLVFKNKNNPGATVRYYRALKGEMLQNEAMFERFLKRYNITTTTFEIVVGSEHLTLTKENMFNKDYVPKPGEHPNVFLSDTVLYY